MNKDVLEAMGMVAFVVGCVALAYGLWQIAPVLVWLVYGLALLVGGALGIAEANRGGE